MHDILLKWRFCLAPGEQFRISDSVPASNLRRATIKLWVKVGRLGLAFAFILLARISFLASAMPVKQKTCDKLPTNVDNKAGEYEPSMATRSRLLPVLERAVNNRTDKCIVGANTCAESPIWRKGYFIEKRRIIRHRPEVDCSE
jgi:hypothetical protein